MIYTVTLNPAIDYVVSVSPFAMGETNRTGEEHLYPGGKGINVSFVLKNLGIQSTALGFVAGFTGDEIVRMLKQYGVSNDFIRLNEGYSRINVKIKSVEGTEINGAGPVIPEEAVSKLLNRLEKLQAGDVLFLSGSIPSSMPSDIYCDMMRLLDNKGIRIVVDAGGELLLNTLQHHPFLIKPNQRELEELFHVSLSKRSEIIPYAKKLKEMGAENVLVSLAGEGAVLVAADGKVYEMAAPQGQFVNGVGAGDAMVAGFMAGWLEKRDYRHAFYMGIAAGSASAFSEHLAEKTKIDEIYRQILMTRIPKVILFDFDRTMAYLYSDKSLLCKLAEKMIAYYEEYLEVPMEEKEAGRDGYFVWHHMHHLVEEQFPEDMAMKINAGAEKLVSEFELQIIMQKELIPGTDKTIRALWNKGIVLGVVSSNATEVLEYALKKAGILECFSYVGGRLLPFHPEQLKPSPFPIREALKKLGIIPADQGEVWYVGDDKIDLEAAKAAEVVSVGVASGRYSMEIMQQAGAQLVFSDMNELGYLTDMERE